MKHHAEGAQLEFRAQPKVIHAANISPCALPFLREYLLIANTLFQQVSMPIEI